MALSSGMMRGNPALRLKMVCKAAVVLLLSGIPVAGQPVSSDSLRTGVTQCDTIGIPATQGENMAADSAAGGTAESGVWRKQDALLDSVTDDVPVHASEVADSAVAGAEERPSAPISSDKTGDSTEELSFDFGITRDNDFNFWPLLRYYRSIDKDKFYLDIALSLYRRQYDRNAGTAHQHLLPFYWHSGGRDGYDTRWLSLFYPSLVRYGTAREGKLFYFSFLELAPQINAMSLMKSDDGLFMRNNLLFLLWQKNDLITGSSYLVFFPALWWFADRDYTSLTFFPLYSQGTSVKGYDRYRMVSPFYWRFASKVRTQTTLFPFWWDRREFFRDDTVMTKLLLPLYWSKNRRMEHDRVVFPFFWHHDDAYRWSTAILPLCSRGGSIADSTRFFMAGTLFWHREAPGEVRNTLYPFWWQRRTFNDSDTTITNYVVPTYWSEKSATVNNHLLFPLFFSFRNSRHSSTTVLPLFSFGRTPDYCRHHLMAGMLYWRFNAPDRVSNTLFPVWWQGQTINDADTTRFNHLLPLWWSRTKTDISERVFFPIVWSLHNPSFDYGAVLPFYSHYRSSDSTSYHRMVAALYWHFRSPEHESSTLFPFWWKDATYDISDTVTTNRILPLYWSRTSRNIHRHTLFPVVWQQSDWIYGEKVQSLLVLPVYYSLMKDDDLTRVIFPLLWIVKNKRYASWTVPPVVSCGHSADGTAAHLAVTPLFWHFSDKNGYSNTLFPLWWQRERRTAGDTSASTLLLPLYWSKRTGESSDHIVFPFVWDFRDGRYRSTTVVPFCSFGASSDGGRTHLMITPLFWHTRSESGTGTTLLPFWWCRTVYQEGDTVTSDLVLPLYWSKKSDLEHHTVLFPLFWNHEEPLHHSTTLLPFFSTGASTDGLRSRFMAAMLYWRFRSMNGVRTTLLPLWWASNTFDDADTTRTKLLLPLYWSKKNRQLSDHVVFPFWWDYVRFDGADTTSSRLVLPLYWSRRSSEVKDHVVFPLVWSLKNSSFNSLSIIPLFSTGASADGTRRHTAITPLYWDFRRNDAHDRYLLPLVHYSEKGSDESACNVLFMLCRYERMKTFNSTSLIWPLVNVTKDTGYLSWRVAPVLWYKNCPQRHYFSVQPLFYLGGNESADHFSILWKVFSHTDEHAGGSLTSFLFNAFFWNRYAGDDHEVRLFYRLYADVRKNGTVEKSFFPFYRSVAKEDGEKSVSALFSIYKYVKKRYPGTSKFYQEDKLFWFIRLRSNYRALRETNGAEQDGK